MLHAKVLRSPFPHARLVRIDATRAAALPGVATVLTRETLDGMNPYYGSAYKDQTIVALDKVPLRRRPGGRGGGGRRGDRGRGAGAHRDRIPGASGGHRRRRRHRAGRAAGARTGGGSRRVARPRLPRARRVPRHQYLLRLRLRPGATSTRALPRPTRSSRTPSPSADPALPAGTPHHHRPGGGRTRDPLGLDPGPVHAPAPHRRVLLHPHQPGAGDRPPRGRRLRRQTLGEERAAGGGAGLEGRPVGEADPHVGGDLSYHHPTPRAVPHQDRRHPGTGGWWRGSARSTWARGPTPTTGRGCPRRPATGRRVRTTSPTSRSTPTRSTPMPCPLARSGASARCRSPGPTSPRWK